MLRRVGSSSVRCLVLACGLSPLARAAQILVPADQPTLAAALAVAAPHDVIVVRTDVWQANVLITKPVTIVGDPVVKIFIPDQACQQRAGVELAGPGEGNVTIANAYVLPAFDCYIPPAPIGGSGFSSLFLYEVVIPPPLAGTTGTGKGTEGLRTHGIPFVALERCTVFSAQNNTDSCSEGGAVQLGANVNHAAVDVGQGELLVLDSLLHGGHGGKLCSIHALFGCPGGLATAGGEGASAVKAGALYASNSAITAGTGSTYLAWPGLEDFGTPNVCWVYGSHPAVIAGASTMLGSGFSSSAAPTPGAAWPVDYSLPSGVSYALFSFGPGAPLAVPGLGTAFVDPATFVPLGMLSASGGAGSVSYNVPNDATLLGLGVCLQPLHATQGLFRPVAAVVVP